MRAWLALLIFLGSAPAVWAETFVLVYNQDNKWVAAEDNAPLRKAMAKARGGTHHFYIKLPIDKRPLSIVRLEIIRDLLAREAGRGVVLEEVPGTATVSTIWLSDKP
ncbi:MAG: hypothetical protein COY40_02275 [Alphaproteobacteria bacterium CG_4_10_14_0_8_um_filter_53_9]|nr:MAG: hypothetical protein COY40_02275 [Alphaproteobacteria bacterium CG_4_10_14_0_8_um_filter_53_9]